MDKICYREKGGTVHYFARKNSKRCKCELVSNYTLGIPVKVFDPVVRPIKDVKREG